MSDPVKIIPRYGDPDASNVKPNYELPAVPQSVPNVQSNTASTMYDYVYTNKWIIVAIIIIIVLVGIGIYYFTRPEEKSVSVVASPANPAKTPPKNEPKNEPSKQDLENILAAAEASDNNNHELGAQNTLTNTNSSKTVEEIEQMLNDEPISEENNSTAEISEEKSANK